MSARTVAQELEDKKAAGELAGLRRQAEEARADLAQVEQQVAAAHDRLAGREAKLLLEANEQLVVSSLRAQAEVESCTDALEKASRFNELDPLTHLPSRPLLLDRFSQAIASAKRQDERLALLFLDLDNFKEINDSLGHAAGDQALKMAARCFCTSVRAADTVCRYGGDEFVILLTDVTSIPDAVRVAEKMIESLGGVRRLGDHEVRLTASIGISLYPEHGEDPATLIGRADAAMYIAKERGLGTFVYDEASVPPPLPRAT